VVDVEAAKLQLAPSVIASTEDLIVHELVEGRELSEADLALPPVTGGFGAAAFANEGASATSGSVAATTAAAVEDDNTSKDYNTNDSSNSNNLQSATSSTNAAPKPPPPRMGRLLDSMVSKLANRLLSDAQDLPATLHQLQRDLPSKLDRVQVCIARNEETFI